MRLSAHSHFFTMSLLFVNCKSNLNVGNDWFNETRQIDKQTIKTKIQVEQTVPSTLTTGHYEHASMRCGSSCWPVHYCLADHSRRRPDQSASVAVVLEEAADASWEEGYAKDTREHDTYDDSSTWTEQRGWFQ